MFAKSTIRDRFLPREMVNPNATNGAIPHTHGTFGHVGSWYVAAILFAVLLALWLASVATGV